MALDFPSDGGREGLCLSPFPPSQPPGKKTKRKRGLRLMAESSMKGTRDEGREETTTQSGWKWLMRLPLFSKEIGLKKERNEEMFLVPIF